jgi:hypothetical protein
MGGDGVDKVFGAADAWPSEVVRFSRWSELARGSFRDGQPVLLTSQEDVATQPRVLPKFNQNLRKALITSSIIAKLQFLISTQKLRRGEASKLQPIIAPTS